MTTTELLPIRSGEIWKTDTTTGLLQRHFLEQLGLNIFTSYAKANHDIASFMPPEDTEAARQRTGIAIGAETPLIPYQVEGYKPDSISLGLSKIDPNTGHQFGGMWIADVFNNGSIRPIEHSFTEDQVILLSRQKQELEEAGLLKDWRN